MKKLNNEQIRFQKNIIANCKIRIEELEDELKKPRIRNIEGRKTAIKIQYEIIETALLILFKGGILDEALA